MKTKYKFLIAKIIFKLIYFSGIKLKFECKRNAINWYLDLSEAIDLSIYLFGKFEHEIMEEMGYLRVWSCGNKKWICKEFGRRLVFNGPN